MIELAIFSPKKNKRYVAWFGHGSPYRGQIYWFSLTCEEYDKADVSYARLICHI